MNTDKDYTYGTVKMWREQGAWGFIASDGGQGDVFVHYSQLQDDLTRLAVGERVRFTVGESRKTGRTEAKDVRVLPPASEDAPAPVAYGTPR